MIAKNMSFGDAPARILAINAELDSMTDWTPAQHDAAESRIRALVTELADCCEIAAQGLENIADAMDE